MEWVYSVQGYARIMLRKTRFRTPRIQAPMARNARTRLGGDKCASEEIRLIAHTWQRIEIATAIRTDVVRERLALKALLHGDELAIQILLEADKHQTYIEGAIIAHAVVVVIRCLLYTSPSPRD